MNQLLGHMQYCFASSAQSCYIFVASEFCVVKPAHTSPWCGSIDEKWVPNSTHFVLPLGRPMPKRSWISSFIQDVCRDYNVCGLFWLVIPWQCWTLDLAKLILKSDRIFLLLVSGPWMTWIMATWKFKDIPLVPTGAPWCPLVSTAHRSCRRMKVPSCWRRAPAAILTAMRKGQVGPKPWMAIGISTCDIHVCR